MTKQLTDEQCQQLVDIVMQGADAYANAASSNAYEGIRKWFATLPDEQPANDWRTTHQWRQDREWKWYQSCRCQRCEDEMHRIRLSQMAGFGDPRYQASVGYDPLGAHPDRRNK